MKDTNKCYMHRTVYKCINKKHYLVCRMCGFRVDVKKMFHLFNEITLKINDNELDEDVIERCLLMFKRKSRRNYTYETYKQNFGFDKCSTDSTL